MDDGRPLEIGFADADQREAIYAMRHATYALELGQHDATDDGRLTDALDRFNHYLTARQAGRLVGFVSITPPGGGRYSIDKYVRRDELPFPFDDGLFEIRILTVHPAHRGGPAAGLLMYAALRWTEEHGATRIVIIGRSEVAGLYERVGMRRLGRTVTSGAVAYELMTATVADVQAAVPAFARLLRRQAPRIRWSLTIPFDQHDGAFHGGAANDVLGPAPTAMERDGVIAADVLDAWFPPAPGVLAALTADPSFLASASPPTRADALRDAVARANGVGVESVVVGAGVSDLIFRCVPRWVPASARVCLVEPQYGEYRHVLERIVGCAIDTIRLDPGADTSAVAVPDAVSAGAYDWVVLVDPNNPLGYRFDPARLAEAIRSAPTTTRFWIDRTYAPFAGADDELVRIASTAPNVVVAVSMSKGWALSGLRVGWLVGPRDLVADAWQATPPWVVSRPAQAAAIAALADRAYYAARHAETHVLSAALCAGLAEIPGIRPRPGIAAFVSCDLELPLDAATIVEGCAAKGVYLRAFPADPTLRDRFLRVAVRDRPTQARLLAILRDVVGDARRARDTISA